MVIFHSYVKLPEGSIALDGVIVMLMLMIPSENISLKYIKILCWLVGWNMTFMTFHILGILGIIIPTESNTTNQYSFSMVYPLVMTNIAMV